MFVQNNSDMTRTHNRRFTGLSPYVLDQYFSWWRKSIKDHVWL